MSDDRPVRDPMLVPLAVVLAVASFVWLVVGDPTHNALRDFPLDDGWIHQVYIRGLLTDHAPTYNPGVPEAGFSSALWLFAAIPGYLAALTVGFSYALGAKLVSLVWAILAAVALARIARRLGGGVSAGRATVLLLFLSPGGAFASASGMEVTLALACLAAALDASLASRAIVGPLLGAACLARPESAVAVVVLTVTRTLRRTTWKVRTLGALSLAISVGLCALPWGYYNFRVTGYPLPNTFYVKADRPDLAVNAAVLARDVLVGASPVHAIVTGALAVVGLFAARRRGGWTVAATGVLGVLGVALSRQLVPGVLFYQQRYFLPYGLLVCAVSGVGFECVITGLGARKVPWASALTALTVVVLLLPGMALVRRSYRAHCEEIAILHTGPALEIAAQSPSAVIVGAEGAGAMRFFSQHPVLDLMGLNDAPLAHARNNRERTCLLVAAGPSLLALPSSWEQGFGHAFELRSVRVYSTPHTAMSRTGEPLAVVLNLARPWPEALARCAAYPGLRLRNTLPRRQPFGVREAHSTNPETPRRRASSDSTARHETARDVIATRRW